MGRIWRQYRPRGVWSKRVTVWMGHNEPWLWPAVFIVSGVLVGCGIPDDYLIGPALMTCWWINSRGMRHAYLARCPRCDAAIPVNPVAGATKHARALRGHHALAKFGLPVALAAVVALFLPWWPVKLTGELVMGFMGSFGAYTGLKHKQFAPWCPKCFPDGGGGPVGWSPDVPPLPTATKTKELVTR